MDLITAIRDEQNRTTTENGANAARSSGSFLVDLYAVCGALRYRDPNEIRSMFLRALSEDPLLSVKLAFYTRDVREGLGERDTARIFFRTLSLCRPEVLKPNLSLIPEYGRWDDLFSLLGTPLEEEVLAILKTQLEKDTVSLREEKPISLLAKWMPGVNASASKTRKTARFLSRKFGMNEKTYRKTLSALRTRLNLTETNLSEKTPERIVYEAVPSLAMKRYRNAFRRTDGERFSAYLEAVKEGRAAIHSSVLYPYDIVESYLNKPSSGMDPVLEEQWKALPDLSRNDARYLIMADVSGSMWGRAMATAVGLAIYFAERNTGPFHNRFMTFSARPELVEIRGDSLYEKVLGIQNADWMANTDLEAAFLLILESAVSHQLPPSEMPSSLIVITDMEFDSCTRHTNRLFSEAMKERFEEAGYELPNLVFWNVNARHNTFHADCDMPRIQLASGQSVHVFESLLAGEFLNPYESMVTTLNSKRYDPIRIE
ncbi:MAG: DUF2828 family protein [Solobacterium sp.]|nr:DUF2828 family protein [Solobacterium sp.]